MNDNPHGDWDRLFEQLPLDTTGRDEHREALRTRIVGVRPGAPATLHPLKLKKIGHILMTYKIPHWTVAATLIIGLVWLISFSTARAFAIDELVENVMKARTARYDMTATIVGQPAYKMKAYYLEPGHSRQELENGLINIADWNAGKLMNLDPENKRATVLNLTKQPEEAQDKMPGNQFEMVRDLLRQAQQDPDTEIESLGEKQINGTTAVGFRFTLGIQPMTIWADPESRFPVTIEATMVGPPKTTVLMTNYEFNVELDAEMFSVAIPDGYDVMETDVDASRPTESDFVASLRLGSELTDGEFPGGFDAVAIAGYIATYLSKKGMTGDELTPENMQEAMRIGRGFQFALTRGTESDAHYAGANVKAGDAERPIFWYKPKGAGAYRVIYADCSVRELDDAPAVAGAVKLTP